MSKTKTKPETRAVNVSYTGRFGRKFELKVPKEATQTDILGLAEKFIDKKHNSLVEYLELSSFELLGEDGKPIEFDDNLKSIE